MTVESVPARNALELADTPVPASRPGHRETVSIEAELVKAGLATREQLDRLRRVQAKLERPRAIPQLLVELGLASREAVGACLRAAAERFTLHELMEVTGVLTPQEVQKALAAAATSPGRPLTSILAAQGPGSERVLLSRLASALDIPFVDPDPALVDRALLKGYSLAHLRRHGFLPFSKTSEGLTVLVSDPADPALREEIARTISGPVRLALTPPSSLERLFAELDGRPEDVGGATKDRTVELVDEILREAVRLRASDIHLEPFRNRLRVRYRVDGVLLHKTDLPIELHPSLSSRIKILAKCDIAERRKHQDGRFYAEIDGKELDLRLSTYVTVFGEVLVLRLLFKQGGIPLLEELGMSPSMLRMYREEILWRPTGVIIITGPTGSGKTTTLYSSLAQINRPEVKIITAEDPVEYVVDGIVQCSLQPKIGVTFAETLRAIVRQDPDVIVLGEIRDRPSAESAIQAALTGHKVLSTFHTEDSVGGIMRLQEMGIESFLISSTVISVVAQRLVRKICHQCKREVTPDPVKVRLLGLGPEVAKGLRCFKGTGCPECADTGYTGRVGLYELLNMNEYLREAILQRNPAYAIRTVGINTANLMSMLEDGIYKIVRGVTTCEEVLAQAPRVVPPRAIAQVVRLAEG
jgi:type IV pilus assembly protein PilB